MNKSKFLQWIFILITTLSTVKMNAQNNNSNQGFNKHQISMVSIAALTTVGDLPRLKTELNAGLDAGLTINQIKEALVQLYAYCGFPRSLNGINTLMAVVEERKVKGITDVIGNDASLIADTESKYNVGKQNLQTLTGITEQDQKTGFIAFAPIIDVFLKEHLFTDIFSRDVLNFRQRELVTISALAAMPGVEPQLQAHITMGKNTGITDVQLEQIAELIDAKINRTQANTVRKLIDKQILPVVDEDMMVRISEIEILPEFLNEYNAILKVEAAGSIKIEPGVVAIFPMHQKENPNQIRIVEIYANKVAYQSHLQTPHFQHYKTTTLKMVKELKLIDMESLDEKTMTGIFKKL